MIMKTYLYNCFIIEIVREKNGFIKISIYLIKIIDKYISEFYHKYYWTNSFKKNLIKKTVFYVVETDGRNYE